MFSLVSASRKNEEKSQEPRGFGDDSKRSKSRRRSSRSSRSKSRSRSRFSFSGLSAVIDERGKIHSSVDLGEIKKRFGAKFITQIPAGFVITRRLGSGKYGTTFALCKSVEECRAMKVIEISKKSTLDDLKSEVFMQRKFSEFGMAPVVIGDPVVYKYKRKKFAIVQMGQIGGVVDDLMRVSLKKAALDDLFFGLMKIVLQLRRFEMSHGDFHTSNIGFIRQRDWSGRVVLKLQLIDFGMSIAGESNTLWELSQLNYTLDASPRVDKANVSYLRSMIEGVIKENYGLDIADDEGRKELREAEWKRYDKRIGKFMHRNFDEIENSVNVVKL